ncbi:MAG: hypothetical protein JW955_21145 [Sedimentisphaerales bacterium]|nr:hypothetical protein [Sedimentisphaerales bacterium]
MSNRRRLSMLLPCLCSTILVHSAGAITLEYSTTAKALAEVGAINPYTGQPMALPVTDSEAAANDRSYARADWEEIQYAGKFDITLATSAKTEPNLVMLTTDLYGSYRDLWPDLFLYYYQWAEGILSGTVVVDEFPPGTPCSLRFEASWPTDTWTSDYYWRFEAVSSLERVECGYDPNGPYGPLSRSGQITVIAGEPVDIFLGTAGEGVCEWGGRDAMGAGRIVLDVTLTATRHAADLYVDDVINFKDFAVFAQQWRNREGGNAADFDGSGVVDISDLQWPAHYWLLPLRPPGEEEASQ